MSFHMRYTVAAVFCFVAAWVFIEYTHPFWAMFSCISSIWFSRQAIVYWFIGE